MTCVQHWIVECLVSGKVRVFDSTGEAHVFAEAHNCGGGHDIYHGGQGALW